MTKKELKQTIIDMKNDVDKLNKRNIELRGQLENEIKRRSLNNERFKIELERINEKLDNAELLNKVLIDNLGNEDTTLFNYNGDTYAIKEITYNKSIDIVDTLNVEMVKKTVKVEPRQGGLIDTLNGVAKSVGDTLNKILYGDKKD